MNRKEKRGTEKIGDAVNSVLVEKHTELNNITKILKFL